MPVLQAIRNIYLYNIHHPMFALTTQSSSFENSFPHSHQHHLNSHQIIPPCSFSIVSEVLLIIWEHLNEHKVKINQIRLIYYRVLYEVMLTSASTNKQTKRRRSSSECINLYHTKMRSKNKIMATDYLIPYWIESKHMLSWTHFMAECSRIHWIWKQK